MGGRQRSLRRSANYRHQNKSSITSSKGKRPYIEQEMDPVELRAAIGDDLYNRVMQWNDSGAVEAMHAAEERRMARKPCWLPKLNRDLFIGEVDWDTKDSGEFRDVPQSAVAFAELQVAQSKWLSDGLHDEQSGTQSSASASPALEPGIMDGLHRIEPSGWGGVDGSHIVKPSGWGDLHPTVGPTGRGELDGAANGPLFSASANSVTLAEAVLETSVDGQRLLVGGQPVEPSGWDQFDTSWPQLGWDPAGLQAHANLKSNLGISGYNRGNYLENDSSFRQPSDRGPERDTGWKDREWYPNQHNSFQRGCYMTAC